MDLQFRRLKDYGNSSLLEVCVETGKDLTNPDINNWHLLGTIILPNDTLAALLTERKITRDIYITDALEFSKQGEPGQ